MLAPHGAGFVRQAENHSSILLLNTLHALRQQFLQGSTLRAPLRCKFEGIFQHITTLEQDQCAAGRHQIHLPGQSRAQNRMQEFHEGQFSPSTPPATRKR